MRQSTFRWRLLLIGAVLPILMVSPAGIVFAGDVSVREISGRTIVIRLAPWLDVPDVVFWRPGSSGQSTLVVVTEDELHRVTILTLKGKRLARLAMISRRGTEPGSIEGPAGAVIDPKGLIWVSDTLNDRLQVFTSRGELLRVIGPAQGLYLRHPGRPAVDANGRIYVPDTGNNRIVILDQDGQVVRSWGKGGAGPGELRGPSSVKAAMDGSRVYVVDRKNRRIQIFDSDGLMVRTLTDRLGFPESVAVSPRTGDIFVTDVVESSVVVFNSSGARLRAFGAPHSPEPGHLFDPQGIEVDEIGRVWVFDNINHRGQVFSNDGRVLFTFGEDFIGVVGPPRSPSNSAPGLLGIAAIVAMIVLARYWQRSTSGSRESAAMPTTIGLREVALFTPRFEQTVTFYQRLLDRAPQERSDEHAVFSLGESHLLIHRTESTGVPPGRPTLEDWPPDEDHIGFAAADIHSWSSGLKRDGWHVVGPNEYPWGKACYLRDPDGRLVELTEKQ